MFNAFSFPWKKSNQIPLDVGSRAFLGAFLRWFGQQIAGVHTAKLPWWPNFHSGKVLAHLLLSSFHLTFQCYVLPNLCRSVRRQTQSSALWFHKFALQEHSGYTKSLLLVDSLSKNIVIRNALEARLLKQLSQELWGQL